MAYLHAEVDPVPVLVKESALYLGPSLFGFERGTVLAICSYPGRPPSFKILLDNGLLTDFIVASDLLHEEVPGAEELTSDDFTQIICPSPNFSLKRFTRLINKKIDVYHANLDKWTLNGRYILTVDWWTQNKIVNLIALPNGQFAFIPNHNMLVRLGVEPPKILPRYRSLKTYWK